MQETQVRTLGQEDTPETGVATATHADVVAWELPQTEEPGELQDSAINTHFQPCVEQSVTHRMYSKTCWLNEELLLLKCKVTSNSHTLYKQDIYLEAKLGQCCCRDFEGAYRQPRGFGWETEKENLTGNEGCDVQLEVWT